MLEFLTKYEPVWLFLVLLAELCISLRNWFTLEKEYEYDKWFNEEYIIPKKRFRQRKAVKLVDKPIDQGSASDSSGARMVGTTPPAPRTDLPNAL